MKTKTITLVLIGILCYCCSSNDALNNEETLIIEEVKTQEKQNLDKPIVIEELIMITEEQNASNKTSIDEVFVIEEVVEEEIIIEEVD